MILSCKEAAKLVSEGLDRDLSLWKRLLLRMHVAMCDGCSAYRRQIESLHTAVTDHYRDAQVAQDSHELPSEALERIKQSLRTDSPPPARNRPSGNPL